MSMVQMTMAKSDNIALEKLQVCFWNDQALYCIGFSETATSDFVVHREAGSDVRICGCRKSQLQDYA